MIADYWKILIDEEVKYILVINFSEYFKSLREEQSIGKVAQSIYIFLATAD